jgi:hypothetical protein
MNAEAEGRPVLEFPTLFSDQELEARIEEGRQQDRTKQVRHLSDPEQLIQSMAFMSTNFPHVYTKIELMWGSPELDQYLHLLITETVKHDGHKRRGFPPNAMHHILKIYNIHFRAIGKKIPVSTWNTKKG